VGSSGAILGNSAPVQLPPGQYPLVMRYAAEKGIASDWPTNLGDGHIWAFGIRDQDNANIDKFVDIGGACWKEGGSFKYFEWAISTKNGLKYGFLAGLGGTLRPTPLLQDKKPLEAMYYATGRHKRNEPVANAYKAFNPDNPRESAWTFGEKTYRTFPWDIVNNDPNKFYARGAYSRGMNMHRTTGDGREAPRVSNWSEGCQVWNSSTGLGHMLEIAAKGADGGKFRYVILNKWWTGAKPDLSGVGPPTQVQPPTAPASSEPPVGNGVLDPTRAGPGWDEASEGSGVLL